MTVTIFDLRQSESHDLLTRLTGVAGSLADDIVRTVNAELTPPFALAATGNAPGSGASVSIGSYNIQNPDTLISHTAAPVASTIPNLTTGTITLGATGGGSATPSSGAAIGLSMAASQFLPIGIGINSVGAIVLTRGTPAALLSGIVLPALSYGVTNVGYFVVRTNSSNNVQVVLGSDIYQFANATVGPITSLTGDVTAVGPGSAAATVVSVGGQLAAAVATAATMVAAATSSPTPNTLVLRDASGNAQFGSVIITGAINYNVSAVKTSTYVIQTSDCVIQVNTTGGGFTTTLPASVAGNKGQVVVIKDVGGAVALGGNALTLAPAGSDTIDGTYTNGSPLVVNFCAYFSITLVSNGAGMWLMV